MHENARSHTIQNSAQFATLAPSGCHLLKDHLSGLKSKTNGEVKEVTKFLNGLTVEFLKEGYQKCMVHLQQKCMDRGGGFY